jgi:VanZ family protein
VRRTMFAFRVTAWVLFAGIAVMTLGPLSVRPQTHFPPDFERFASYGVLGILFALSYPRRRLWITGALLVVAAGTLEMGQSLVPHRDAHLIDFLFKAAGTIAGLVIGRFFQFLHPPLRLRQG